MSLAVTVVPAPGPIGALTVGVTAAGLALVGFGAVPELTRRAAARLGVPVVDDAGATAEAEAQLAGYLAGERRRFTLPLDWSLTAGSQRRVLQALRDSVPFGATVTYGELALRAALGGGHTAARGVGAVMGSNPIPVVVPCHRVLAADGLGGFGGGRATKEWLLALEGVLTPALDLG
ncbi:methylated-DNA--[protein]-cysteine S-methyltransferase [Pseudonocardia sp.]|uniref:methylated-DNA--[protein]-cysteine S-methyltransferase n=1 Tax=Pseudonocardia sp. TaxID=60912 RepID=UPI0026049FE7|nr:methylated-DNA--[protein]-cysteine S-methyltransferase [Pseudonocardia sp.]